MGSRVVTMVTKGEIEGRDCSCISPTKPEVMLPETEPTGRRPSLAPGEERRGKERRRERESYMYMYLELNNYNNYYTTVTYQQLQQLYQLHCKEPRSWVPSRHDRDLS